MHKLIEGSGKEEIKPIEKPEVVIIELTEEA